MGRGFGLTFIGTSYDPLVGTPVGAGTSVAVKPPPSILVPVAVLPPPPVMATAKFTAAIPNPPVITPPPPVVITPPPPVVIAPPPVKVVVEHIPLSDPRNPQHTAWLAQQKSESPPYLLYAGLGAAVLGGAAWWFLRKPKKR